ncbi:MAG: NAD-dependent epimerase/dehydratase family protein [Candidatus Bathyarchaeia archaeon]
MRILVTGGAGFIGTHLCKALNERGYEVVALDNNYANRKELLSKLDIEVIHGDVLNPKSYPDRWFDAVFHLAVVCLGQCMEMPFYGWKVNTEGTLHVCRWAEKTDTFMIYVSSSEAYGHTKVPMHEDQHLRPTTLYGASKATGELITRTFFYNKTPLSYLIIRPFNTYGPYAREDKYAMAPTAFIRDLLAGREPVIYGLGQQTRDWTYIDDTVRGLIECYEHRKELALTPIVNICSGKETSINQLLRMIQKVTGSTAHPEIRHARKGDIHRMWGDPTRAKILMGFEPTISLKEGFEKYVKWWKRTHE